ncbi:hypothetical protein M406DRAFT_351493 [Cryphonectria parasitica EP155]|uniref:Uncharacterized protein n=1 Tax=Cryphonectria parasitica (strain ATCC 38755 / EP155) TaxID=660469 RepID=A0A9P5CPR5_CRYP1|nr:uncharacterized protein M406DRAFT_351493 [Cryphonectria parasitica EP155]KAF3766443.1 hypothetical protein M406DRAFT_351493 [Cryphonectria parasitica EP155]
MWSYDNGSSRRSRDNPPSSSRRYYGPVYDQPYYDDGPLASSVPSYDRHRRKSVPVNSTLDETRQPRRAAVIASDDGFDKPFARSGLADPYSGASSRHDVEAKTSDRHRHFRDKRGTYEIDEGQNLRRAKSYSPHRAAREAEAPRRVSPDATSKSGWQEADYAAPARRSSTRKGREQQQQYYDEEPSAKYGKPQDRARTAYDYGGGAMGSTIPTARDYPPYKSSPLTSSSRAAPEEKVGKHSRGRDKTYYQDPSPSYAEAEPPRRDRRGRHAEDRPSWEDDGYPPRSRAKQRPPPADDYEDPYASAPRQRHRQSVPPQARSRHEDPSEDPYAPPRRRATSASQGAYGGYNNPDARDRRYQDDDGYGSYGASGGAQAGPGGSRKKDKSKKIGKQAGKLFMTHAFPVIKQEAVPFLTKAAQAYFESSRK